MRKGADAVACKKKKSFQADSGTGTGQYRQAAEQGKNPKQPWLRFTRKAYDKEKQCAAQDNQFRENEHGSRLKSSSVVQRKQP